MKENNQEPNQSVEEKVATRQKEQQVVNKIVKRILLTLLVLIVIGGIGAGVYISSALKPLDTTSKKQVYVKIPIGTSNKGIASTLEKNKVIKNATIFNYYVKAQNVSDFQAGDYHFSASMTLNQIIKRLKKGSNLNSDEGKVLIKEGVTLEQVGDVIAKQTEFKKADFLALMKKDSYLTKLQKNYPKLLDSTMQQADVRYHLEGYLYPATYEYYEGMSLEELVDSMIKKTNEVLVPYYEKMASENMSVQEVLTLASLVEREGVTEEDRAKIAGVFFNRIYLGMPLQSDISILYALNTHKENVTYKDLEVDSPYNLYKNKGYGPGPFNNPSLGAINAVLNPAEEDQDYLYFVANLKTGKVYFSKTLDEHTAKDESVNPKS